MGCFTDFKAFLMKGEIVNLATAVIVGGAFGKIVTSFTNDVLMPPIGLLLGKVDFKNLKLVLQDAEPALAVTLQAAAGDKPAVMLAYGKFIQTIFDFVIIAFAVMMGVKAINSLKRPEPAAAPAEPVAPAPSAEQALLAEIRDLLKQQST